MSELKAENTLLPCPFCGSELVGLGPWNKSPVRCSNCGAQGPVHGVNYNWNTRHKGSEEEGKLTDECLDWADQQVALVEEAKKRGDKPISADEFRERMKATQDRKEE